MFPQKIRKFNHLGNLDYKRPLGLKNEPQGGSRRIKACENLLTAQVDAENIQTADKPEKNIKVRE